MTKNFTEYYSCFLYIAAQPPPIQTQNATVAFIILDADRFSFFGFGDGFPRSSTAISLWTNTENDK